MYVKDLVKQYNGKKVVDKITFEINKGKVTSFIGPNGAGKSTIMSLISRLISKDEGQINFEGFDINKYKSNSLAKKLAVLSQTNNISLKLTVKELVAFGRFPYSKGNLNEEDNKKIEEAISYMGLLDIENKYLDELSGGQRQRAFIAMVVAQDTEYILLDEPTNNLDIYFATELMKTVRKLCDELNKTIILVLHEINYASFYSDYICAFKDGKILKYGNVKEVINEKTLKDLYNVDFEIIEVKGKPLSIYY